MNWGMASKSNKEQNTISGPCHGMALGRQDGSGMAEGPSPLAPMVGYLGAVPMGEGGVRAGGVSARETMPTLFSYPKSGGFDEHRRGGRVATVSGVPGVEGLEGEAGSRPDSEDTRAPRAPTGGSIGNGFGCPHAGCGFAGKTSHGLAQHYFYKHHGQGFAGVQMNDGNSYRHAVGGYAHGQKS